MEYNVEFIKVSDLKPYENNVKKHDEEQIEQIIKSIKEFGFKQNLVIDKNNVVVVGHGRLAAAEKMGLDVVPCIRATDLSDEQIKALRIADNKLTEKGIWDNDALAEELKSIADSIDMTDFGFGDFELTILTNDFEPEGFDEEEFQEYEGSGEKLLVKRRVIITYVDEEEDRIKKLLGVDEIKKVVYDIKEVNE